MQLRPTHQDSFDAIKEGLTKTPVPAYFNPNSEHVIQTDASLKGLRAYYYRNVDSRPVLYISRTLTPAEDRYFNIEGELFAQLCVWRTESSSNLETIWKKSISTANPRLQRLHLRLTRYEIKLEYIKGSASSRTG